MVLVTREFAENWADDAAIIDAQGLITWSVLDTRANKLVHALRQLGVKPGETLAIVAGNRSEWFEIALACAHGGWVYVPVNWHWVADELAYVMEDAEVRVLFVEAPYFEAAGKALQDARSASVRAMFTIGADDGALADPRARAYEGFLATALADEPPNQIMGGDVLGAVLGNALV